MRRPRVTDCKHFLHCIYLIECNSRGGCVEGLEDDLDELLPVGFGVEGSLGVEMRGLVRGDSQLVVEGVMPDLLHVVPVGHDAVLNGVFQREDT